MNWETQAAHCLGCLDDVMETPEVVALKRAVVSGGCSPAHSCYHCSGLRLPVIPKLILSNTSKDQVRTNNDRGRSGPFWYSRSHARQCADSGCSWWLFIHKQIRRHELVCEAKSKWKALVATKTGPEQDHPEENNDKIEELESVFLSSENAELLKNYLDKRAFEELLQLVSTENLFDRTIPSPPLQEPAGDVDSIWFEYSVTRWRTAQMVLNVDMTLVANGDHDKIEGSRRSFSALFQVLTQPGE